MEIIIKTKAFIKNQIFDIKTYGIRELLRKILLLVGVLVRILIDIINIVPCLIIRLISPWLIVRILKLRAGNFGNFISFTAMFYCKKKLNIDQPKKRHLDLAYIHYNDKIFNKQDGDFSGRNAPGSRRYNVTYSEVLSNDIGEAINLGVHQIEEYKDGELVE